MAKNSPAFPPKSRIEHAVYGTGTIVETNERYTTIAFDEAGTRKFLTERVELVGSDTEAPAKRVRKKKVSRSKKR
jgi:hypothetical protein